MRARRTELCRWCDLTPNKARAISRVARCQTVNNKHPRRCATDSTTKPIRHTHRTFPAQPELAGKPANPSGESSVHSRTTLRSRGASSHAHNRHARIPSCDAIDTHTDVEHIEAPPESDNATMNAKWPQQPRLRDYHTTTRRKSVLTRKRYPTGNHSVPIRRRNPDR